VASAIKKNKNVGAIVVVVGVALAGSAAKGGTTYLDPAHRFSVQLPARVTAQDVPAADRSSETLIFSDGTAGDVQITITPWDTTAPLTTASALPQYAAFAPPRESRTSLSVLLFPRRRIIDEIAIRNLLLSTRLSFVCAVAI
jgi:hypothetical protein